jgi:hypothetical protein
VKTNKNDVADAEAICEAVARPNMRFVPVKSVEQHMPGTADTRETSDTAHDSAMSSRGPFPGLKTVRALRIPASSRRRTILLSRP